jgi:hypothetical protein
MNVIHHIRNGTYHRWEVEINGESVSVTTSQLQSQGRFSKAVFHQSMKSPNYRRHSEAFTSLTTRMGKAEWMKVVNGVLIRA